MESKWDEWEVFSENRLQNQEYSDSINIESYWDVWDAWDGWDVLFEIRVEKQRFFDCTYMQT